MKNVLMLILGILTMGASIFIASKFDSMPEIKSIWAFIPLMFMSSIGGYLIGTAVYNFGYNSKK
jgi:multisubunit Na+/H+ antiporter MnhG subunit